MMIRVNVENNYQIETSLYEEGYNNIAGTDEVGRGPMAGPVVACAVVFEKGHYIEGVTDSKKISDKKRRLLYNKILNEAKAVGVAFVSERVIDKINIYEASRKAMERALFKIKTKIKIDYVLTDAMPLNIDIPQMNIIKGDENSFLIGCASIVAKVVRDDYMIRQASKYPQYGFEKHKGYVTKAHREAIQKYGVLPIHRKTYKPVMDILEKDNK